VVEAAKRGGEQHELSGTLKRDARLSRGVTRGMVMSEEDDRPTRSGDGLVSIATVPEPHRAGPAERKNTNFRAVRTGQRVCRTTRYAAALTILCVAAGVLTISGTAVAGPPLPLGVGAVLNGMFHPARHRHRRALAVRRWDGAMSAENSHASRRAWAARHWDGATNAEKSHPSPAADGRSVDWAGSVFWPSAYADTFGYILLGVSRDRFWSHGYADIYDGILTSGMASTAASGNTATDPHIACRDARADEAGSRAVDRFNQALHLNDPQSARLDGLRQALAKAGERIRASCPDVALLLTPMSRLATMWQRLRALRQAVRMVRVPLHDFYSSLSDEQRARLDAGNAHAGEARTAPEPARKVVQLPDQPGNVCTAAAASAPHWPAGEIERVVQPNDAQRPAMAMFSGTSARLGDMLNPSCPAELPLTPTGRLDAVEDWLDGLISAVTIERAALGKLYAVLSDEQKATLAAPMTSPLWPMGAAR
jgi:hypothetical protein